MKFCAAVILILASWLMSCSSENNTCSGILVGNVCVPDDAISTEKCILDTECLPLAVCIDGYCGKQCTDDGACKHNFKCELYRCVPRAEAEDTTEDASSRACSNHVECDDLDMACIDGRCARECSEDWHCDSPNLVCRHYQCTTGDPVDVVVDTNQPDVDFEPDAADTHESCPSENRQYGQICTCGAQCTSGLCVPDKVSGSGMCTQECPTSKCPSPDLCIKVMKTETEWTNVCVQNDAGQPVVCNPDYVNCHSTFYLQNGAGSCVCTNRCLSAKDCPEDFSCHVLSGSTDKVCVPVGAVCQTVKTCYGLCAGMSATQGFCTAQCVSNADCPDEWSCVPVQEGVTVCNPD